MAELDLAACTPVNDLWPALVERLGLERSARAARQAFDLQAMRGQPTTVPVPLGPGVLLLCSPRLQQLQLLQLELS
jgi:hypothetical protein